jgi:PPOX class probable F420-dependent enzyme
VRHPREVLGRGRRGRRRLAAPGPMATLNPDGSPQLTPVWAGLEDGQIAINTSVGRVKEENLRRDPRVSLCCMDTENPYHRVEIRGRAVRFVVGERRR